MEGVTDSMKITNYTQEFITDDNKPFDSAHASTLLELKDGGILAAWFGGAWEKNPDVAIWTAIRDKDGWGQPVKAADVRGIAMWNPVLFRKEDGKIILFYKVGKLISEWVTWYMESEDEGHTFSEPQELVPGDIGGRGPVKNKPIRLSDGTVLAPGSLEGELWDGCEFPYKSRVMGTSEPLKPLKAPYMARNPVKWGFFRLKGQEIPLKI